MQDSFPAYYDEAENVEKLSEVVKVKKVIAIFLVIMTLVSMSATSFAAKSGLSNFKKIKQYDKALFSDVVSGEWYEQNVKTAYELGLMKGTSDTTFNPEGMITIAETIVLACRLHSIYNTGSEDFQLSYPWYQAYVDYARREGFATYSYADYNAPATREECAAILVAALPDAALEPINRVDDGTIPDVPMKRGNAAAIYKLYRAGIVIGNDSIGTFTPTANIERGAVAAIVSRVADPTLRASITLKGDQPISISNKEFYERLGKAKTFDELRTLMNDLTDYDLTDEQRDALLDAMILARNGGSTQADSFYIRAEQGWDGNGNVVYASRSSGIETITSQVGLECTSSAWYNPGDNLLGYEKHSTEGYKSSADRYVYELEEIPQGKVYSASDRDQHDSPYNQADYNKYFVPYINYLNSLSFLEMVERPSSATSYYFPSYVYKINTGYGYEGMLRLEWHDGRSQFSTYTSRPANITVYVNEYFGTRYDK